MNEKEKNAIIYMMMCKEIEKVFTYVCENDQFFGDFYANKKLTVKDLESFDGISIKNSSYFDRNFMLEVSFDGFSCKFPTTSMFYLAKKFRSLSGAKEYTFFYKKAADIICEFDIPKDIRNIIGCTAKDDLRPVMNYVFFDTLNHVLVSCDGKILKVTKVNARFFATDYEKGMCIHPCAFKNGEKVVKITRNEHGKYFANGVQMGDYRYPNYRSVICAYSDFQKIEFSEAEWKEFSKIVKAFTKLSDRRNNYPIEISGNEFGKTLKIATMTDDEKLYEKKMEIAVPLKQDLGVTLNGKYLQKIKSAKEIYVRDSYRAITCIDNGLLTLVMPIKYRISAEMTDKYDDKNQVNMLDRCGIYDVENTVEKVTEQPKESAEEKVDATPVRKMSVGDFVSYKSLAGEKVVCKIIAFSEDNLSVKLNLLGEKFFSVPVGRIEPTEEREMKYSIRYNYSWRLYG